MGTVVNAFFPVMMDGPSAYIEIESLAELRAYLEAEQRLQHVVVQGLDLTPDAVEQALRAVPADDAYFLGCRMTPALTEHVRRSGGTIFPLFEGLPFHPYRAALYTPDELMRGYEQGHPDTLNGTVDARIYHHFVQHHPPGAPVPVMAGLAYRIHDHAIDDALHDLLYPAGEPPKRVVGVMGGHRMARDAEVFAQVVRIAWDLARRGYFIATGGGPGAMEAANLGAYLAAYDEAAVAAAVQTLAPVPHYEDPGYFEAAYAVREAYPDGRPGLAVPTWFYGHEPSNLFASYVAKYFANSIREDGLLAIARHGVLFAPGSAGTLQEVFMDAAQNHYATFGAVSPMVFFGRRFWTKELPVYSLLERLAQGRAYAGRLALSDDVEEVVQFIVAHPPVPARA